MKEDSKKKREKGQGTIKKEKQEWETQKIKAKKAKIEVIK